MILVLILSNLILRYAIFELTYESCQSYLSWTWILLGHFFFFSRVFVKNLRCWSFFWHDVMAYLVAFVNDVSSQEFQNPSHLKGLKCLNNILKFQPPLLFIGIPRCWSTNDHLGIPIYLRTIQKNFLNFSKGIRSSVIHRLFNFLFFS